MGRPSDYTPEVAAKICERLEESGSLSAVLTEKGMPARSTVYAWEEAHGDFRTAIARARRAGYDNRAEKAADDAKAAGDPALGRLALDADRWFLSKIDPKRYGDKTLIGSDPDNPLPSGFDVRLLRGEENV